MVHFLEVRSVFYKGKSGTTLTNIQFSILKGQRIAVSGESGAGKSTLLKIIAGLLQADQGEVLLNGTKVLGPNETLVAGHPGIVYMSQHVDLQKNLRVEQILSYANTLSEEDLGVMSKLCKIDSLLSRQTHELSGGEKQRVALAKLLLKSPELMLLDEPYSNLDRQNKKMLQQIVREISEKLGITCVLVSHDPEDVLSFAENILVLKDGKVVQVGTPEDTYYHPVNEYVAGLFGEFNQFNSAFGKENEQGISVNQSKRYYRPEELIIQKNLQGDGIISKIIFSGSFYRVEIMLAGKPIVVHTQRLMLEVGDRVSIQY